MSALHDTALPGVFGMLDSLISRIESFCLATGVLLMAVNTIVNVIGRFAFGEPLFFSEELNRILIILITFAGISYAARQARHIRMSAVYDMLPNIPRKALMVAITLITAAFMFLLCYFSVKYMISQAERGRVLPALQIPVWITLIWVPAGFFMTGMQYLLTAIRNLNSSDIYLSTRVKEGYENADEIEV